jgi:hypothetical protein
MKIVRIKKTLKPYYYNYPRGRNLFVYPAGTLMRWVSTPPKVRKVRGSCDYFASLEPIGGGIRASCEIKELEVINRRIE